MKKVIESDYEFVAVELAVLTKSYPMTNEMLFSLLTLRGDISRNEFKEVVYLFYVFGAVEIVIQNTIFKFKKYETYASDEAKIKDESMLIIKKELKLS